MEMAGEMEDYRRWVELSKSKLTAYAYLTTIKHFSSFLGGRGLGDATSRDVTNFLYEERERG